ncbi:eCIS core domain-containing protein [Roseofilum casamattae]|uniref:DUF4157 domain-containing protein n=1 Tax=Roseofilum casamattae BLCC-M143 TaxID=3022442 RepID=A0ABT7BYU1_9CYAN|nr:DUF4157 domain-containing protein [Roseofilum casamattae]MDJ1184365.1 DUF4157 domain-containing protein [Roseofilum casamattae BLCC-M143]
MATKVKAQVPATSTPAAPAKNSLPPPRSFVEPASAILETSSMETAALQTLLATPTPPKENNKGTVIQEKHNRDSRGRSALGYSFGEISVAPVSSSNDADIQPKNEGGEGKQPLGDGSFKTSKSIESRIQTKQGGGRPLPKTTRSFMEDRFGNDFSKVRIHTDSTAVQLSQDLQAKAFTHGHDIYFNSGYYNPSSNSGKHLLAHELTHTIQQKGAKLKPKPIQPKAETPKLAKANKILSLKQHKSTQGNQTKKTKLTRKLLAQKIQRKEEKSGVDVNLKPIAARIQRKSATKSNGIDVNLKPSIAKVQRQEQKSGVNINLKPLAADVKSKPSSSAIDLDLKPLSDRVKPVKPKSVKIARKPLAAKIQRKEKKSGVDVNLKPLAVKIQRKEEKSGVDVNLKPLASQIQRTKGDTVKIQPELIVGAPNDRYEQEADRMADAVMDNSTTSAIQSKEDESSNDINLQLLPEAYSAENSAIDVNLSPLASEIQRTEESIDIQPELVVGAPNDPYEQEADRMADAVMDNSTTSAIQSKEDESSNDINLKPLAETFQETAENSAIDVNLKPLAETVRNSAENSAIDVNLKPEKEKKEKDTSEAAPAPPPILDMPAVNTDEQNVNITLKRENNSAIANRVSPDPAIHLKPEKEKKEKDVPESTPAPPPMLDMPAVNTDEQNVNITLKRETGTTSETKISQPPTRKTIQRAKKGRSQKSSASLYQPLFGGSPSHGGYVHEEENDKEVDVMLQPDEEHLAVKSPEIHSSETNDPTPTLQASSDGSFAASSSVESKVKSSEGGGSSLAPTTKNFMESRFDNDFSNVRVHTDSSAVQMNKDLGAKAFTHKNDIYFNSGQYNPSSSTGKHLIAHELTHTIQQTGPSVRAKPDIQQQTEGQTDDETEEVLDTQPEREFTPDTDNAEVNLKPAADSIQRAKKGRSSRSSGRSSGSKRSKKRDTSLYQPLFGGGPSRGGYENEDGDEEVDVYLKPEEDRTTVHLTDVQPSVRTKPDIQKEGDDDETKKSVTQDVNENTKKLSDDDYKKKDLKKLKKEAKKTEDDVTKKKGKKPAQGEGGEGAQKEGENGEGQEGDVVVDNAGDATEQDVTDELQPGADATTDKTQGPVIVPDVLPGQLSTDDPMQNPAFVAVTQQMGQQGDEFAKHDDPTNEAGEVQDAVVDENQPGRKAQENKADNASSLDPGTFDREAFVQQLFAALGIEEPKNMQDVEGGGGVGSETEGAIDKGVGDAKKAAGGGMPEASQLPLEPKEEDIKPVKEMEGIEGKVNNMDPPIPQVDKAAPIATSNEDVEDKLKEQQEGLTETFGPLQPQLIVGGPQDKYEVEADRMADTVMGMNEPQPIQAKEAPDGTPKVNKQTAEEAAQTKPSPVIEQQIIRAKSLAAMIHRSPQQILQRKNEVEPQQVDKNEMDLGTGTGKTISTKDMETFGDMGGKEALGGLQDTQKFSQEGPQQFRQEEEGAIADTKTRNQDKSKQTTEGMQQQRVQTMTDMTVKKEETKGANEAARLKITEELNAIYAESQAKVDGILAEMDAEVNRRMELGKRVARRAFEIVQRAAFKRWQKDYYYHRHGIKINLLFTSFKIFNIFLWAKEKLFTGLPDEVNNIYSDAREVYVNFLRQSIAGNANFKPKVETKHVKGVLGQVTGLYEQLGKNAIAPYVEQKMGEAKAAIDEGKANLKAAVDKLGPEEKQLAQGAISNIQGQFNNLENNVKAYQENLVNDITESYKQGLKEIDDRIEALKAANQGLVMKALAFIGDLLKAILKALLIPIKWILSKFGVDGSILDAIIDDPGGFMSNLFTGLKDGFLNFAKNFPKHFLNGLVEWLFGNIGPIKLPAKFDLQGFFDIFLQIMGFSKDAILAIAAEVFGYDIVNAIKEAIEGANIDEIAEGMGKAAGSIVRLIYTVITKGPIAAWDLLVDIIDEMKMIFIKELSIMVSIEVVKAAITWLIGILNPAAGIIKIIKAVVDVIIWFAQNYKRIIELIKTIMSGLSMIAKGDTAGFSKAVELVLAGLIPIALGFLASLIGLGGIANKIRKIIQKVTGPFRKRLKKMFDKVAAPFKKAFGKAKAWGAKKYNSAKKGFNKRKDAAKKKFQDKFGSKKKKNTKKTEKQRQKDEYKRKVKQQKTEVTQIISQGESQGEKLIEQRRDPKDVKKGVKSLESSVEKGKEFAEIKSIKVKTGMMGKYSNKYTMTGTIKKLKIPKKSKTTRRQPMDGNANLPMEALQTQAQPGIQRQSDATTMVQLKKDKWKDKKNKLIVSDKSSSSKFVLEAKLIDESDVLSSLGRDIERKARQFKDKQPTLRFKPLLPKYKKQYDLTSINLENRTGLMDKADRQIEYEITAKVPPQEDTKARRKAAPGSLAGAPLNNNVELRIQRSQGKGEPLSNPVRQPMEQAFGVDFGGVRIHRKTEGDTLSRSLNAKAFTTGQDIYFRSNTYRPNSPSGGHLLAHELTHVVQQSGEKPAVQRSPFFPNQLVQRQGDGAPPPPLLSQMGNATVIQRDGEGEVPDTAGEEGGSSDFQQKAVMVGAVAAGTAVKMMDSSSNLRTDVDVYKDISKKKGTLEVFVRVQKPDLFGNPDQQMNEMAENPDGIPEFTRTLIARYIEQIIKQDPTPAIVEQKLPEVVLKFDLDMVKLTGSSQIGGSYEYTILVQGNPKSVAQKKIQAMLKKMAKLVSPNKDAGAQQQDGSAELPPTPTPSAPPLETEGTSGKNTRSTNSTSPGGNGSTQTQGERAEGETPTQERARSNATETQPPRNRRPTNTQNTAGETPGAPPILSTKTKIKPTGNPKTFFVKARVDPQDRK